MGLDKFAFMVFPFVCDRIAVCVNEKSPFPDPHPLAILSLWKKRVVNFNIFLRRGGVDEKDSFKG